MTVYYHGGPKSMLDNILRGDRFKTSDELGSSLYTPIPGRVYISKDIGYTIIYAMGANMAGHKWNPEHAYPSGSVLEVEVKDTNLLWPDEDEIGRIIAMGYGIKHHPGRYGKFYHGNDMSDKHRELMNLYEEVEIEMPEYVFDYLNEHYFEVDLYDVWVMIGKQMINVLKEENPYLLHKFTMAVDHVSTPPTNLIITKGWVIDNKRFMHLLDESGSNFFDYAEPVNISTPILAHGVGRGWHNDSYRHSLAARGVRTR